MDHVDDLIRSNEAQHTQLGGRAAAALHVAPSEELQRLTALVLSLLQQMPGTMPLAGAGEVLSFLGNVVDWMSEQRCAGRPVAQGQGCFVMGCCFGESCRTGSGLQAEHRAGLAAGALSL
jgi:hypothetical protein